jgi:hypothetical protein
MRRDFEQIETVVEPPRGRSAGVAAALPKAKGSYLSYPTYLAYR